MRARFNITGGVGRLGTQLHRTRGSTRQDRFPLGEIRGQRPRRLAVHQYLDDLPIVLRPL